MNNIEILLYALLFDALIKEPDWLWTRVPHPVKLMGDAIGYLDQRFNNDTRINGALTIGALISAALVFGMFVEKIPTFDVLEIILVTVLLAHRSLVCHVLAVANALKSGLDAGQVAVGRIVGRDTAGMDQSAIARAAIESASENFSDGVIAPALWFLIFGIPGILAYKLINTADSMIGYRSEKYLNFGWAAARLDDVVNLAPARLAALLICSSILSSKAWKTVQNDARKHRSPNAGWPEAAMAGALDIALAGPRVYHGKLTDDVYVNPVGRRELAAQDIQAGIDVIWRSWGVFVLIIAGLALIF